MISFSADDGFHWSSPETLIDGPDNEGNLALGVLQDGTLLLGYEVFGREEDAEGKLHFPFISFNVIRSTDHGKSWSSPTTVPVEPPWKLASYSRIIQLPDQTILMPLYRYREETDSGGKLHESFLYRSRDGGQSWGDKSRIASRFNETNVTRLNSGTLLAAMREMQKPRARSALSRSTDNGYTWSRPRFVTSASEHPASIIRIRDGRVILTYGVRHPPAGAQAIFSTDGGQTWIRKAKFMVGYDSWGGGGYPCTLQLTSGDLLTVYYGSNRSRPFVQSVRWAVPVP